MRGHRRLGNTESGHRRLGNTESGHRRLGSIVSGHRRLGKTTSRPRRSHRHQRGILHAVYQPRRSGKGRVTRITGCGSFGKPCLRHTSRPSWGTCQKLHKLTKRQVVQPPHPPYAEGLLKGTVEEVLEGRIIVPQALCCPTERQGKPPHVGALLTDGTQDLKLEDALVEGAADVRGWWLV